MTERSWWDLEVRGGGGGGGTSRWRHREKQPKKEKHKDGGIKNYSQRRRNRKMEA